MLTIGLNKCFCRIKPSIFKRLWAVEHDKDVRFYIMCRTNRVLEFEIESGRDGKNLEVIAGFLFFFNFCFKKLKILEFYIKFVSFCDRLLLVKVLFIFVLIWIKRPNSLNAAKVEKLF